MRLGGELRTHAGLAGGAIALAWFVALVWWALLPPTHTVAITIPQGTALRVSAGEIVSVLPDSLRLRLGDELRVVNRDVSVHRVGPAFVPPGQVTSVPVTRSFFDAGGLICTFHPGGALPVVPLGRPHVLTTVPIGMLAGLPLAFAAVLAAGIAGRLRDEEEPALEAGAADPDGESAG